MESRAFIKNAVALIKQIKDQSVINTVSNERNGAAGARLQRDINHLFSSLQNPTLPTAYRLRDTAIEHGYTVEQNVLRRLSQFEQLPR